MTRSRFAPGWMWVALSLALGVGILGRGIWTPDEPREADIAWRMSWQNDKAVPLLAGEAFCEKPPLTYWIAGGVMKLGTSGWIARLPNLLYALVTALAVGSLGRRASGAFAGAAAAAAISTLLLSYQVAIWLATDAPLLACVSVALLGLYVGFHAGGRRERLTGYTAMHGTLALGFLSKSAAAWMVPVLALGTLMIWERRFKELLRWELYAGLLVQAAIILTWVGFVYAGPDGIAHLKVFFWNNLAGRFTQVDAPDELQYAGAHRNSPGKYLVEMPVYLWPWSLLVIAALRRAWTARHESWEALRPVRFALAVFVPTLAVLSVAATARNIYLAPALPGVALLLGWWSNRIPVRHDRWDLRALYGTSILLMLATLVLTAAVVVLGRDDWNRLNARDAFVVISASGLCIAGGLAVHAWVSIGRRRLPHALFVLLLSYCVLLSAPASQIYRIVDASQDLSVIGRAVGRDADGLPLVLFAADETTRAWVDMYARTPVTFIPGIIGPRANARLRASLAREPGSLVLTQLPARSDSRTLRELAAVFGMQRLLPPPATTGTPPTAGPDVLPPWAVDSGLHVVHRYALPNGRRYALLSTGSVRQSADDP